MPTVNEGDSATVIVEAGKALVVSTDGEAYVDYIDVLPGSGFSSDRILGGARSYAPMDLTFQVKVRAISGTATYVVAYPAVPASDVKFRRADSGSIDALIDPKTGEAVPLGAGDGVSVAWGDVTDKPAVIAAGDTAADARQAIGAGTSNFSGAYDDLSGKPTLGTAAGQDAAAFATAAQGAKADSAVQPGDLGGAASASVGAAVTDATDETDVTDQFNALLASLRTAGLIASS